MKTKDIIPGEIYAYQRGRTAYANLRPVKFLARTDVTLKPDGNLRWHKGTQDAFGRRGPRCEGSYHPPKKTEEV